MPGSWEENDEQDRTCPEGHRTEKLDQHFRHPHRRSVLRFSAGVELPSGYALGARLVAAIGF